MKFVAVVNISSVTIFLLSFVAWTFLIGDYMRTSSVDVKGVRTEVSEAAAKDSILEQVISIDESILANKAMASEEQKGVIIPEKEEGVGKTYVRAKAAVAIDVDSEAILHDQNSEKRLQIASLTKFMTALVTIDSIKNLKKEVVVINKEVLRTPTSIIGCPSSTYCFSDTLKLDEEVLASDLLEAMVVNSANDAAVALSGHIAGSQAEFAKLMNKKAREIGLKNTNFCNPSGLDDDDNPSACYSTARDVAQIVVYALKNEKYDDLWRIFKIDERWFNSVDGSMKHRYASTNILLKTMDNCIGAKTGFTYQAGKTLLMIASHPEDEDIKVVSVILDNPHRFDDMKSLFDWTFENYSWKL